MKKSLDVPAKFILSFVAAAPLLGCSDEDECRDSTGNVAPSSWCTPGNPGYRTGGAHWVHTGGFGSSSSTSGGIGG